jgi:methylenetetrahydrofolate dehydrogenase (NADP+) / methenyltetrahydrofolate cyclohydrolase
VKSIVPSEVTFTFLVADKKAPSAREAVASVVGDQNSSIWKRTSRISLGIFQRVFYTLEMQILDGKSVAKKVRETVRIEAEALMHKYQAKPGLAVVLVGDDSASQVYVGSKLKACAELGFASFEHRVPANISMVDLKALIVDLNQDDKVHGILVQLPLPKSLDEYEVISTISPLKDVDGLAAENIGLLAKNKTRVAPCTPSGVIEILKFYGHDVKGLNAVVVGRSQIVGLPMAQLLLQQDATVTVCHSKTKDLRSFTKAADLVVVAAGRANMLGKDDFKKDAIVIDVGIHRLDSGKLCGDVKFEELQGHAKAATPVPGGVGPMTIAMLMKNTLDLFKIQVGR